MIHFFQKADTTVKEMWIGILLWGILSEAVCVWFMKDKLAGSFGILIGGMLAAAGVYHMWKTIDQALELGEDAQKFLTVRSWMRYGIFVAVFAALMVTKIANPLTAFLGLMGMKMSAYLQPTVHKVLEKRR